MQKTVLISKGGKPIFLLSSIAISAFKEGHCTLALFLDQ